jgi:hypothetical protein
VTSSNPIVISEVEITRNGRNDRLRANVDGDEIWYDFDASLEIQPRLEPFLPTALLLGMAHGRDIRTDGSAAASPKLLKSLETLQRIIRQWNPESHAIAIDTPSAEPVPRPEMVASTYSGGVDSTATLLRRFDEITHLVFLSEFDRRSKDAWPDVEREMQTRIAKIGKKPITIQTNVIRRTVELGISSHVSHGAILCAVLSTLAPRIGYVPTSTTYRELKPWGSHPLTDPLWSTEATEISHDSHDMLRTEKTALVATNPLLFSQLQVCWYARTENCGKCSKCLRTMLALKVLGLGRGPFPDIKIERQIEKLNPTSSDVAGFCWDLMYQARRNGHPEIAKQLERMLRRYKINRDLRSLIKSLVGKEHITSFNRMRGKAWVDVLLPLRDPDDFD